MKIGMLLRGAACAAAMSLASAAALAQMPQQVIVKWRAAPVGVSTQAAAAAQAQVLRDAGGRIGVTVSTARRLATGGEVLRLNQSVQSTQLQDLVATLAADPRVEYVHEDRVLKPMLTPNDPLFAQQWHYQGGAGGLNVTGAWDQVNGSGVRVAVLDTGYRPHADLNANIINGFDFVSDVAVAGDGNGRDSSALDPGDFTSGQCGPATNSSWHGTHVSGTVAAVTNNGSGVAGVAFGARVVAVRVLGRCGGLTSDIADAIIWASGGSVPGVPANPNPARVINMSLGGGGACDPTSQNAINQAVGRGTSVIVAAGNSSANAAAFSPASCNGVVTVAANNRAGGRAFYSNFGAVVEVAAPGGETTVQGNGVLSTLNTGTQGPAADTFAFFQGTSMATPHVAGTVALMLSRNGSLTPAQVTNILRTTARPAPACSQCGSGIVNALAAVNAAGGGGPGPDPDPDPNPPGTCPAGFTRNVGNLANGQSVAVPSLDGTTHPTGFHRGRLTGPAGTDFDLFLQRRNATNTAWVTIARAEGPTSTESIDFNGLANRYRWVVLSFSGSGQFQLCRQAP